MEQTSQQNHIQEPLINNTTPILSSTNNPKEKLQAASPQSVTNPLPEEASNNNSTLGPSTRSSELSTQAVIIDWHKQAIIKTIQAIDELEKILDSLETALSENKKALKPLSSLKIGSQLSHLAQTNAAGIGLNIAILQEVHDDLSKQIPAIEQLIASLDDYLKATQGSLDILQAPNTVSEGGLAKLRQKNGITTSDIERLASSVMALEKRPHLIDTQRAQLHAISSTLVSLTRGLEGRLLGDTSQIPPDVLARNFQEQQQVFMSIAPGIYNKEPSVFLTPLRDIERLWSLLSQLKQTPALKDNLQLYQMSSDLSGLRTQLLENVEHFDTSKFERIQTELQRIQSRLTSMTPAESSNMSALPPGGLFSAAIANSRHGDDRAMPEL
jgi:hypothetical protein